MVGFKYVRGISANNRLLSTAEELFKTGKLTANLKFSGRAHKTYYLPRYLSAKRPVLFVAPRKYPAYAEGHPFCPFGDNLVNDRFDPDNRPWKKLVFLIEDNIRLPDDQNLKNVYFGKAELHEDLRSGSFWTFEYAEPSKATHVLFETYHSPHPVSIPLQQSSNLLDFGDFYDDSANIGCYILTSINVTPQAAQDEHGLIKSIVEGPALDYAEMYKEVLILSYYQTLVEIESEKMKAAVTPELKAEVQKHITDNYPEETLQCISFGEKSIFLSFGGSNIDLLYNEKGLYEKIDEFSKKVSEYHKRVETCRERETAMYASLTVWFENHKTIYRLLMKNGFDGFDVNVDKGTEASVTVTLNGLIPIGSCKKYVKTFDCVRFIDSFDSWIKKEVVARYRNLDAINSFIASKQRPAKKKAHK